LVNTFLEFFASLNIKFNQLCHYSMKLKFSMK
jgi:hypothetical protein